MAGNLIKLLLSLYGTEWRERGYGLSPLSSRVDGTKLLSPGKISQPVYPKIGLSTYTTVKELHTMQYWNSNSSFAKYSLTQAFIIVTDILGWQFMRYAADI